MKFISDIKLIRNLLLEFRKKLFYISLIVLGGSAISALIPFIYGRLVDFALDLKRSFSIIILFLLIWLFLSIFADFLDRVTAKRSMIITEEIVNNFLRKVLGRSFYLPMSFHIEKKKGPFFQRVFISVDYLHMMVQSAFIDLLPSFLTVVIILLVIIFKIDIVLGLVLFSILLFYGGVTIKKAETISNTQQKMNKIYERIYGEVYDKLLDIEAVKLNTNEDYEREEMGKGIKKIILSVKQFTETTINLDTWQQTIFTIGFVVLFGYSVYLLRVGQITAGNLVTFVGYIAMAFNPFSQLASNYRIFKRGLPAIGKSAKILKEKTEDYFPKEGIDARKIKGMVEFKNVHFSYLKEKEVFKKISFKITPGEAVALVGSSGAGKSTLVDLLQRYYLPQKGQILVDGNDINKFNLKSYRNQIAVVPQEIILFNASIKQNLRYGNLKATEAEIRKAARQANAEEFIESFSQGYNQLVGNRGAKLSVGQKQRIAIARAILRNPRLLILDEATSSLDSETEKLVQQALRNLIKGRTTIVIAHRFSTIDFVDRIIVLKKGKIVEQGKHKTLMSKRGEYYKLYMAQKESYENKKN